MYFFRDQVPRVLTSSAIASNRVLDNPELGIAPHLEFIDEVVEGLISAKEGGGEITLERMLSSAKMFFLGKPNKRGEPLPSPPKVV